ncbi:hypothetical protein FVER53590_25132 [Fusarium verticillioides]|nr:hypothetical protein FVER53590_25132 [Fusarium verticillioides]
MLDTSDELHELPVHGTYFNKAWASGNGVSKVTNGDMRIVRQYVRASRLFIPRDGAKHMPDHLPVEISGENLQSMWDKAKVNEVSFTDNTERFDSRTEPPNFVAGINTIFHEGCTVFGKISRLQRFVKDKVAVFEEQPAPMARLVHQNNRVLQYLPVGPLQNLKVSDDAGHQPSHRTFAHRNGIDTHWIYHVTPLGIVEPPKELIDRLIVFL